MKHRIVLGMLALGVSSLLTSPMLAQTTYTWNNTGTDWGTAANWSPGGGPPLAIDTARFLPTGSLPGTTVQDPNLAVGQSALSLTVALNQNLDGWNFTGANSLTLGGAGSTGLTTYGPATYNFNGPTLAGSSGANTVGINVGVSSRLVLTGNSAVTANQGNVNVFSGTLQLDNTATNVAARLLAAGTVTVSGGGVFELIGNATGTTTNVGALSAGANTVGGVNTFRITPNGASTVLNFSNSAAGFSTRPGTRAVYQFQATSGNLGDLGGARVTFVGTPFLGANGLLGNSAGGGTVGYAIATDAGGTDFATWNATNGIVRATPSATGATAAAIQGFLATDRVQFNPTVNETATATITNGSLRVTPAAAGLTLDLAANNLATNAFMLNGPNNYTITAANTATLAAPVLGTSTSMTQATP